MTQPGCFSHQTPYPEGRSTWEVGSGLVKAPWVFRHLGSPVLQTQSLKKGFWCERFIEEEAWEGGREGSEDVVPGHLAQTTLPSCL